MEANPAIRSVIIDVVEDLRIQGYEWGGFPTDDSPSMNHFLCTLVKQLGLISETFLRSAGRSTTRMEWYYTRGRMVKIAAVAIACADAIDRRLAQP